MFKNLAMLLVAATLAFVMFGCEEQRDPATYEMDCIVVELNQSAQEFAVEREDGHIFDCVIFDGHMPKIGEVYTITFDDAGTDKVQDDAPISATLRK